MADDEPRHELAVRTSIAVLTAGAGLFGSDAGAVATALTAELAARREGVE